MMLMRWQLAYPGHAVPLIGNLLNEIVESLVDLLLFFGRDLRDLIGRTHDVVI